MKACFVQPKRFYALSVTPWLSYDLLNELKCEKRDWPDRIRSNLKNAIESLFLTFPVSLNCRTLFFGVFLIPIIQAFFFKVVFKFIAPALMLDIYLQNRHCISISIIKNQCFMNSYFETIVYLL